MGPCVTDSSQTFALAVARLSPIPSLCALDRFLAATGSNGSPPPESGHWTQTEYPKASTSSILHKQSLPDWNEQHPNSLNGTAVFNRHRWEYPKNPRAA